MVINNSDLVYAYNNLLPDTGYAKTLANKPASCSSISFYWSISKQIPELEVHNIFLADEYQESFDSIFKDHLIPTKPSFYVNVPSRIDPSAAPEGMDAIVVLVPVGHLFSDKDGTHKGKNGELIGSGQDWETMVSFARDTILSTIQTRIGVDIAPLITNEIINTPYTWKDKFNLDKGAILGLSHSFFNVLSFRPKTRHAKYKNLYFVGASTHPGTGVPICIAGSKLVAEQILQDVGVADRDIPWRTAIVEKAKSELDRMQTAPVLSWLHVGALFLAMVLFVLFQSLIVSS